MSQVLLFLGGCGLLGLAIGVAGIGIYGPYLFMRFFFLRMTGSTSEEAVKLITQWRFFPEDPQAGVKVVTVQAPAPGYSPPPPRPKKVNIYAEALKPDPPKPVDVAVRGAEVRKGCVRPKERAVHMDECIPNAHVEEFQALGYDVTHARGVALSGASDEANLAFAYQQRRVLVTYDVDFLILHHRGLKHAGILKLPQPSHPKGVVEVFRKNWA